MYKTDFGHINPIYLKDFYKVSHFKMYPEGTTRIVSNFTPRKSRLEGINYSVFFGLKYLIEEHLDGFNIMFFNKPLKKVLTEYQKVMKQTLGYDRHWDNIEALHKLGYLPIEIKSLPEGAIVPCGVPALVIFNTHPAFYWVTNMLETMLSCVLWGACTSATIAREYRLILDRYAIETSDMPEFVDYQAHDFSFRGMYGMEAAVLSGMAHLNYFKGSDSIPAILAGNHYYNKPLSHGTSIPASEHSIHSAAGKENELENYKRLITEVYPAGMISLVMDTWDLFNVIDKYLPVLKKDIMQRNGRVICRPDSGDPVKIICGDNRAVPGSSERAGVIERLWDIFGGTINSKGYKQLDSHIGAIYGDSITLDRCEKICAQLKQKGFASTNIVFGVGSYSYQYQTRDSLGWAMKATYAEINGKGIAITKNPKTDDGTKKSHSGLLKVIKVDNHSKLSKNGKTYKVLENMPWNEFVSQENELKTVYKDGEQILEVPF